MKILMLLAATAIALLACAPSASVGGRSPGQGSSPPAEAAHAPQTPMTAKWRVVSDAGGKVKLLAVISRFAELRSPVDVTVRVPPGVEHIGGRALFRLMDAAEQEETVEEFEFAYAKPPTEDLVLEAHAERSGMGIHAADVYRFGRPEPKKEYVKPSGADVQVGNVNLGPAIQLQKK